MKRGNFLEKAALLNAMSSFDCLTESCMPERLFQKLFFKNRIKRYVTYRMFSSFSFVILILCFILGKNGPRN